MHISGLCGIAIAALAALPAPAAGLSNTSPFVLLSESQSLRKGADIDLGPAVPSMSKTLENIVGDAALSCKYDAYIFVKHPNVSERDVSEATMPWLVHAAKKVRESVLYAAVLDGSNHKADDFSWELEQNIAKTCGAKIVPVDRESGTFQPYADTQARIMSIDFTYLDKQPGDVDAIMRNLVGHLPSANFLLSYRTTPVQAREVGDDASYSATHNARISSQDSIQQPQPSAGTAPAAADKTASSGDIPYESVFRNYQFFTPGIFMGLLGSGTALVILLIALKAVNSLQISLAAFEPRRQTAPTKAG